jgi:Zn-dependent protease with chaperone function
MFALRGAAVSFAVLGVTYCALSLVVSLTWRRLHPWTRNNPLHRVADFLFLLRIFPLFGAGLITFVFAVPSFVLLEPRNIDEPIEVIPFALALCGAILALAGICNAVIAMTRASRTISQWVFDAESAGALASIPVLRIRRSVPAMAAAGVFRPKLLVSRTAESVLSQRELQTALNHEIAHVRRRDNLRKLVLHFVPFFGMKELESSWLEATEMAADDAAVSSADQALDLASALIKLSRMGLAGNSAGLTTALIHSPVEMMNARVERLISWSDATRVASPSLSLRYGLAMALTTSIAVSAVYSHLLLQIHAATEWLMR